MEFKARIIMFWSLTNNLDGMIYVDNSHPYLSVIIIVVEISFGKLDQRIRTVDSICFSGLNRQTRHDENAYTANFPSASFL